MKRHSVRAFTIVELLVTVAIIGILASLAMPEFQKFISRSQSVQCMNNLRQIGVSVLAYMGDNDNAFPMVEPNPNDPVYEPQKTDVEGEYEVPGSMLEVLGPYGLTEATLKCPADLKGLNAGNVSYFKERNSSYQWRIFVDGENAIAPNMYWGRRGYAVRSVKPSRVTLCTDFEPIHSGRMNRLYGDGHVAKPY